MLCDAYSCNLAVDLRLTAVSHLLRSLRGLSLLGKEEVLTRVVELIQAYAIPPYVDGDDEHRRWHKVVRNSSRIMSHLVRSSY